MKWKTAPFCPIHRRTYLYKYTSSKAALSIFKSGKVRYSSPLLFNDPFDIQTELVFDFDIDSLADIIHKEIEDIIFDRKEVEIRNEGFGQALLLLREAVRSHGYYAEELRQFMDSDLEFISSQINELRIGFNDIWQDYLPRMRVFSMSEVNNSILMWSHYADFHRGVVLKLNIIPELDSPLWITEPVIYKSKPPAVFKAKQWIEDVLSINPIDHKKLTREYARMKSDIWEYEKEWRVWDLPTENKEQLFSDYTLYPEELGAIYLGCSMNDEIKNEIIRAARTFNPSVDFYQSEKSQADYGLIFKKI